MGAVGFDQHRELRLLRWAVGVLLAAGVLSLIAKGANGPADPHLRASSGPAPSVTVAPTTVPSRASVPGFGRIAFHVGSGLGPGTDRCALLAETAARRRQGLMDRTDLADFDGMLFVFQSDTTERFWMRNTPLPLSIAWFDASGRFVSSTDMVPCLDRRDCPTYGAARPYRFALEVPRGGLGGLGVGPGATLVSGGTC